MPVDFRSLLSKPLDDVKRPPALPAGTYYGTITGHKFAESRFADQETGEKHAVVHFTLSSIEASPDVDEGMLAAAVDGGKPLAQRVMTAELPLSGGNEWITKSFLESLDIPCAGRGFGETIPETLNQRVMFSVTQRADKNNIEVQYNDVRSLRAVPKAA